MAILKDTLIQGNARVTDTLYANTLSADDLAAKKLTINHAIDNGANNTQGLVLKYQDTDKGHLGINNSGLVGLYATGSIAIRPDSTLNTSTDLWSATTGIQLTSTAITPSGSMALGSSSNKFTNIFSTSEYTNNIILTTTSSDSIINSNQIDYVNNNDISYAKIAANTNGTLGLFSKRIIGLYPAGLASSALSTATTNEYQETKGVWIDMEAVCPMTTNDMTLGQAANKWANIYSTTATLNGLDIIGGDLVMSEASGHGATHKLIFQRGTATDAYSNWKLYNDSVGVLTLQVYHSGLTGDTDIVEILPPTSGGQIPTIQPGTTGSYKLGTSSLQWLSTYSKEFIVDTHVTLAYNSSDLSLNFNFS